MDFKHLKGAVATRGEYERMLSKFYKILPNANKILMNENKPVDSLSELLYDPHISSCIQSRKSGVLSLEWEINKGINKTAEVDFINDIFNELNLTDIITQMLDASLYGYKVMEVIWIERDGKVIPIDIIGKPCDWFFFDPDNRCRFRNMSKPNGEFLPGNKFFVIQNAPTYDNPYGESILAKCYWSWFYKHNTIHFWASYTEKYGMPFLHGTVPVGTQSDEADELRDKLDDMRQDGVLVTDEDKKTSLLDASNASSPAVYQNFVHFFNAEISKAILSQTLTTEQGVTGSYAMSQTHLEVRQDVVDSDKRMVEFWLNKLIEWIVKFNFGEIAEMPRFEMYQEEDVDKPLAEVVSMLTQYKQVEFTKEFYKRRFGFADDEINIIPTPTVQPSAPFAEPEHLDVSPTDKLKKVGYNDFVNHSQEFLQPVLDLINSGMEYDEIQSKAIELYPQLDTHGIENVLANSLVLASTGGYISALN